METLTDLAEARMEAIADSLREDFPDVQVGGWGIRVKRTEHCDIYLAMKMFGNWRLLEVVPHPSGNELAADCRREWCYGGPHAFTQAFAAALVWDGAPDSEPSGWVKSVNDERRHGAPRPGIRQM